MRYTGITPIEKMGDIYVKREDLACFTDISYPSGSKVRQYLGMAKRSTQGGVTPPCLVGCSANSAQQVYVAATAKQLGTKGIIYTAKRKIRTDATAYCLSLGAEVNELRPAYLSYVRAQAKARAKQEGSVIEWDQRGAIEDAANQCEGFPEGIKRIIVPTGSGLTAAGVAVGVIRWMTKRPKSDWGPLPRVVAVGVSTMTDGHKIIKLGQVIEQRLPFSIHYIEPELPYDTPVIETLPDGTPLDPFYAAKAYKYLEPGDLLWTPGLRPIASMPESCRDAFKGWQGPQGHDV